VFALDSGWASEVREFGEETVDHCATSNGLDVEDQRAGGLGPYGHRRVVGCFGSPPGGQNTKVHTDDGVCDVGHHEPPCEIPA
jgi:hypothetical protein